MKSWLETPVFQKFKSFSHEWCWLGKCCHKNKKKKLETLNTKKQHLHEDILSVNLFYLPSLTKNILLICIEKNKKRGGGGGWNFLSSSVFLADSFKTHWDYLG